MSAFSSVLRHIMTHINSSLTRRIIDDEDDDEDDVQDGSSAVDRYNDGTGHIFSWMWSHLLSIMYTVTIVLRDIMTPIHSSLTREIYNDFEDDDQQVGNEEDRDDDDDNDDKSMMMRMMKA